MGSLLLSGLLAARGGDSGTWTTGYSDGSGIVVFSGLPIGSMSAFASGWPSYYSSDQVQVQIATGVRTSLSLTIAPAYAGTAIVLATRHINSTPDGSEIELEADIAVVDPSDQPTIPPTASHLPNSAGCRADPWLSDTTAGL